TTCPTDGGTPPGASGRRALFRRHAVPTSQPVPGRPRAPSYPDDPGVRGVRLAAKLYESPTRRPDVQPPRYRYPALFRRGHASRTTSDRRKAESALRRTRPRGGLAGRARRLYVPLSPGDAA